MAWHAKVIVRLVFDIDDPALAGEFSTRSSRGITTGVSNGPTEAINNLIKRTKQIAFGFRNVADYRIRVLPYAGKPNRLGLFELIGTTDHRRIRGLFLWAANCTSSLGSGIVGHFPVGTGAPSGSCIDR